MVTHEFMRGAQVTAPEDKDCAFVFAIGDEENCNYRLDGRGDIVAPLVVRLAKILLDDTPDMDLKMDFVRQMTDMMMQAIRGDKDAEGCDRQGDAQADQEV